MLQEMVSYAVEHRASQVTLHRVFYSKFREKYPWLPTRVVKGCYRDAARRARSFRRLKRKGVAKTDKPVVRRATLTYSDPQDWRLESGILKVRTHRGWVEVRYRSHKHLHRYLYSGWRPSSELRLKLSGRKVVMYLTFTKDFEVVCDAGNVVAVDVNEDNVTAAVFRGGRLREVYRVETGLRKLVISYAERRKRVARGRSTKDREVREALKRLGEKERKRDVVYKAAKIIEELAARNNAIVAVGNVHRGKRRLVEGARGSELKHRLHQWSVAALIKALSNKPLCVVEVSEVHTSTTDPFTGRRIAGLTSSMIRLAVRGRRRVKVVKVRLRLAKLGNGLALDRDVVGAVNIGLRYLSSDGSPVALGSTEPHEVRVKLVTPHRGLTPLTELKVLKIS